MKKKQLIIATVCVLLAFLLIGSLFVAAGVAFSHADNFQFGGLVGELLAGNRETDEQKETNTPTENNPDTDELLTDSTHTEDFTYQDTTDTNPEPAPDDTPALRFFLGGGAAWINGDRIVDFFESGKASEWNHHAVIDDYNAEYVTIWGWAAIFTETPMQLGYRLDDGQPVYGHYSGFSEADQTSTMAALGMGAIRAANILLQIPVQNLSGTHTVNILVRNQGGNDEGVICTFELEKAKSPYDPVFLADAVYLTDMLNTQRNVGISDFQYNPPGFDGASVYMKVSSDHGYLTLCPANGEIHSTGARYLAIKYCEFSFDSAEIYVGSGTGPGDRGDHYIIDTTEIDWQFIIIDLEEIEAVNDSYDMTYLRFDFFTKSDKSFEIAYIATFKTVEDAQRYNAEHPYAKG